MILNLRMNQFRVEDEYDIVKLFLLFDPSLPPPPPPKKNISKTFGSLTISEESKKTLKRKG